MWRNHTEVNQILESDFAKLRLSVANPTQGYQRSPRRRTINVRTSFAAGDVTVDVGADRGMCGLFADELGEVERDIPVFN